jgi:hypothetical protein
MEKTLPGDTWLERLGWLAAWAWTVIAGGGGLVLLVEKGPWPLTNGWYAFFSGLSACPATAWLLNKYMGVVLSGWVRFGVAAAFLIAGRVALATGH